MRFWLEMSRDIEHGGGDWAFTQCLWSPTRKKNGHIWAYWETVREVRAGDLILHLRGEDGHKAKFVGWSSALKDGEETRERPPTPGALWEYSSSFYRVKLSGFNALSEAIALQDVFTFKKIELLDYFERNKRRRPKLRLFFVWQAGRLQCLNGAYCSELDVELVELLVGDSTAMDGVEARGREIQQVSTGTRVREMILRVGQARFARLVKANFDERCCFPGCVISGPGFLVAGHIARWSDHPDLRGDVSNGLSFCPMHDRAFELGLFTITSEQCIHVNELRCRDYPWARGYFDGAHGQPLRPSVVRPALPALVEHWRRHGIKL